MKDIFDKAGCPLSEDQALVFAGILAVCGEDTRRLEWLLEMTIDRDHDKQMALAAALMLGTTRRAAVDRAMEVRP